MCGINGILSINGSGSFAANVSTMNDAIAHRGPNDAGIFSDQHIHLGHRRLSIIDLSSAGHQPMRYSHGGRTATLVFNGEIYNFLDVRRELEKEGYTFASNTDSEIIPAAYFCWGKDAVNRFNGMFAFALWDHQTEELWLVRDRLGIKPIYYCDTGNELVFSSEIRAVLRSGLVKAAIDPDSFEDYLMYQTVHAPHTIVQNVKMLLPGHSISAKNGSRPVLHCWWKPTVRPIEVSREEAKNEVLHLLRSAVERRLVADVPFGAFLSGGIDSSAIVALMQEVSTAPVNTFSVSFDDSEFDEARFAQMVAKKYGTHHHEIRLRPDDFLQQIPAALDAMDHPSGDGPNTYVVSGATRKAGITMALSGLGGDELFAGYDIFKRSLALENNTLLQRTPRFLRKAASGATRLLVPGIRGEKMAAVLSLSKLSFDGYYPQARRVLLDQQVNAILNHPITSSNRVEELARQAMQTAPKLHLLSCVSLAEISTYMQNVLLRDTDQMSMAHALEVRVPFLDYTLVEYLLNLPDTIKYPHSPKQLLVEALGNRLPSEIVNRPKMGFTFPWKNWMRNELKSFCATQLSSFGKRENVNEKAVQNLWESFLKNDPKVTWSRIWLLVVLEHWMQKNGFDA